MKDSLSLSLAIIIKRGLNIIIMIVNGKRGWFSPNDHNKREDCIKESLVWLTSSADPLCRPSKSSVQVRSHLCWYLKTILSHQSLKLIGLPSRSSPSWILLLSPTTLPMMISGWRATLYIPESRAANDGHVLGNAIMTQGVREICIYRPLLKHADSRLY